MKPQPRFSLVEPTPKTRDLPLSHASSGIHEAGKNVRSKDALNYEASPPIRRLADASSLTLHPYSFSLFLNWYRGDEPRQYQPSLAKPRAWDLVIGRGRSISYTLIKTVQARR